MQGPCPFVVSVWCNTVPRCQDSLIQCNLCASLLCDANLFSIGVNETSTMAERSWRLAISGGRAAEQVGGKICDDMTVCLQLTQGAAPSS